MASGRAATEDPERPRAGPRAIGVTPGPEIVQLRGLRGAREASGLTVLIDVLRAFTTAAYAFAGGAGDIVLVATVEEAVAMRRLLPDALLIGEVDGRRIAGFDLNNSPTMMAEADVAGRRLIQRTGAGTRAVVAAAGADERVLGSLVVAGATARYLQSRRASRICLVSTNADEGPPNEDDACARYLAALLGGRAENVEGVVADVRSAARDRLLTERLGADFPATDIDLAVAVDRFGFAMAVLPAAVMPGGPVGLVARRVEVPKVGQADAS